MKYLAYVCEGCGCRFAVDAFTSPASDVSCPNCGDDYDVTETGEGIESPNFVPIGAMSE